jgi:hypothetical protein
MAQSIAWDTSGCLRLLLQRFILFSDFDVDYEGGIIRLALMLSSFDGWLCFVGYLYTDFLGVFSVASWKGTACLSCNRHGLFVHLGFGPDDGAQELNFTHIHGGRQSPQSAARTLLTSHFLKWKFAREFTKFY